MLLEMLAMALGVADSKSGVLCSLLIDAQNNRAGFFGNIVNRLRDEK
ncbi:MAG: hypothetical protein KJ826_08020 [Proteobacteria bacterium]|nr:hypothetical protein [Pseudomonadota bacterium]MBU4037597.1 hypothetical protein [Pseudomonadota bacterium]